MGLRLSKEETVVVEEKMERTEGAIPMAKQTTLRC